MCFLGSNDIVDKLIRNKHFDNYYFCLNLATELEVSTLYFCSSISLFTKQLKYLTVDLIRKGAYLEKLFQELIFSFHCNILQVRPSTGRISQFTCSLYTVLSFFTSSL